MSKNIAIIGASYLQLPLIQKAKDMGYTTHVFAWAAGDVGESLADHFYPISIVEKEEILPILEQMVKYPNVMVRGLMAIPPISQNPGENSKFFQEIFNLSVDIMRKKYDNVSMDFLSMGMSDDFTDAIRCGSNMIRIGTAIFGARNYAKPHQ